MDDQNKKDSQIKEEEKTEVTPVEEVVGETVEEADVEEKVKDEDKKIGINDFHVGDTIRIMYRILEGDKLRTQPYEGIVISKRGEGMSKSFTVRRIGADNIGIERIFPAFSPNIDSIKIMKKGKVRRAKLYYLRKKVGRAAMRIKEIKK
jgi:large subunit ribosomal protein L19